MYVVLSDDVVYDVSNYDVIYTIQWEDLFLFFFQLPPFVFGKPEDCCQNAQWIYANATY